MTCNELVASRDLGRPSRSGCQGIGPAVREVVLALSEEVYSIVALTRLRRSMSSSLYISFKRDVRMNSRSVSTSLFLKCSFSRLIASNMTSELGLLGSITGMKEKPDLESVCNSGTEVPFADCDCCCARRSAASSRLSLFTCDSDSASRTFSRSIFSSRSWAEGSGPEVQMCEECGGVPAPTCETRH
jgi:hypothetical protein